jgi:nitrogen fixation/metabolism regulation signal transduction histidine kinase
MILLDDFMNTKIKQCSWNILEHSLSLFIVIHLLLVRLVIHLLLVRLREKYKSNIPVKINCIEY